MDITNRIRGAWLGCAVGDAIGAPVEFHPNPHVKGYTEPPHFTDDTQMALSVDWGLESANGHGVGDLSEDMRTGREVALELVRWRRSPLGGHRAPGGACLAGTGELGRRLSSGKPLEWWTAGGRNDGGCGAIMRSFPYGVRYIPETAALVAASHARMTHRHEMALASAAGQAWLISALLDGVMPSLALEKAVEVARAYDPVTADLAEKWRTHPRFSSECLRLHPGWSGRDAFVAAIHIVAHTDDPLEAVLRAVNHRGDSDSLGAIVGAIVGARDGDAEWGTERWLKDFPYLDVIEECAARGFMFRKELGAVARIVPEGMQA